MSTDCLSSNCSSYLSGPTGQVFASSLQLLIAAQCLISNDWPPDSSNDITDLNFDFIVVGAGTAGSIVASRLSEDGTRRVLLVEAGEDPPFESQIPASYGQLQNTKYDWQYRPEKDYVSCQGWAGGQCLWPAAKILGGASSINGMKHIRGNRQDYDDLEAAGNIGWNYEEALKYFKISENMVDPYIENDPVLSKYHNYSGPMGIIPYTNLNPLESMILNAYQELGYPKTYDINGPLQFGVFQMPRTIKQGRRSSTANAYLEPIKNNDNLVLLKKSMVTKILFSENVAIGVEILLSSGVTISAMASREIVVCAGAVRSPQILMLSGIGPREHLEEFNITVISDLAVGHNLVDHVMLPVYALIDYDLPLKSDAEKIFDVAEYVAFQTGYYSYQSGIGENIQAFITSDGNSESNEPPNFQIIHYATSKGSFAQKCDYTQEICNTLAKLNENSTMLTIYPALIDQESRGIITLASNDPTEYPKIFANAYHDRNDVTDTIAAIKIIDKLINTPTFKSIGANIPRMNITACNVYDFPSNEYWECIIYQMGTAIWHTRGTCKMGPTTDPTAVVDPELKVYGVSNLRVVDASVIPGTIRGNTQAPVMMFAEKASDLIKDANRS